MTSIEIVCAIVTTVIIVLHLYSVRQFEVAAMELMDENAKLQAMLTFKENELRDLLAKDELL